MVDLRDRNLVVAAPRLAAVERDRRALIEAEEHALAVGRIDPRDVRVLAAGRALERDERLAAVGRSIHGRADRVDDVGILRVDPHAGAVRALAVGDARVVAGHVLPRRALVVGTKEARAALHAGADHVHALAVRVHRDRHADAAGVGRQRRDLRPRLARVERLVERRAVGGRLGRRRRSAAPAASAEAATRALGRREHDVRHVVGVLDVARAVRVLRPQRVLPRPAAIGRAVDALARVSGVALRRGDDEVGILRVDDHLVDLDGLLEADVRPRLARVGGLVHAVAERALHGVAGADVDDVRDRTARPAPRRCCRRP